MLGAADRSAQPEQFDTETGLPTSEVQALNSTTWYAHTRAYSEMKWPGASAKHRASIADTLATITPKPVKDNRRGSAPEGRRQCRHHRHETRDRGCGELQDDQPVLGQRPGAFRSYSPTQADHRPAAQTGTWRKPSRTPSGPEPGELVIVRRYLHKDDELTQHLTRKLNTPLTWPEGGGLNTEHVAEIAAAAACDIAYNHAANGHLADLFAALPLPGTTEGREFWHSLREAGGMAALNIDPANAGAPSSTIWSTETKEASPAACSASWENSTASSARPWPKS